MLNLYLLRIECCVICIVYDNIYSTLQVTAVQGGSMKNAMVLALIMLTFTAGNAVANNTFKNTQEGWAEKAAELRKALGRAS